MYMYNDVTTRLTLKKYLIHVYVNTKSTLNSVYFWRWLNTDIGKCGFLKKKKNFFKWIQNGYIILIYMNIEIK